MRKSLATLAAMGLLSIAPAAMASEPATPQPVAVETPASEANFRAPQAQTADQQQLAERHQPADRSDKAQAAGYSTTFAIGFLIVCAIFVAVA